MALTIGRNMLASTIILTLTLFTTIRINAQHTLQGTVFDDLNQMPVTLASITVIDARDSMLTGYARANEEGFFKIPNIKPGDYKLLIAYPDYIDFYSDITFSESPQVHSLDTVFLIKNDIFLNEVTILDNRKFRIKGDTIQFIADSFKVGTNATVEDLLKKLDGMSVNAKGEITAFGKKVEKVYVDGEEFFGNDPTIATRNIQAKAIDKVQVFDKTSEMEELTGIADGEAVKSINLTLKDEYKKGYFGKLNAGVGLDPLFHDATALLQGYTGKSKIAFYGVSSNTGRTGLNFEDMNTFIGGQGNFEMTDDGGMMIQMDDDINWSGRYNGEGLPNSKAAGGSFTTKSANNKVKFNINYGYSDQSLEKENNFFSTQFLPERSFNQAEEQNTVSQKGKHSVKSSLDLDLDSLTTIKIKGSGNLSKFTNHQIIHSNNSDESVNITQVDRILDNEGNDHNLSGDISLTKKFKKKKRLLTFNANYKESAEDAATLFRSRNQYFIEQREEMQNQLHDINKNNQSTRLSTSYTEPIGPNWTAQANYKYAITNSLSERIAKDFNEQNQAYDAVVDSLSNAFKYKIGTHGSGLTLGYKKEKFNFRFGTNVEFSNFELQNKYQGDTISYDRIVWMPQARFNYKFSKTSDLNINYNGYTRQPSINQIQPVRNNTDPLNQVKGNPNLEQSYTQSINLWYNFWKSLAGTSLWSSIYFSNTFNDIVSHNEIDSSGRNISSYVNVDGNYNLYGNLGYHHKLSDIFRINTGLNTNSMKYTNFVNNQRSTVYNNSFGVSAGVYMEVDEVFNLDINYDPTYTLSKGGLVRNAGNYWQHSISLDGTYNFTERFGFETEVEYNYQARQSSFNEDFSRCIWNASLNYFFDKNKQIELRLSVFDILNQNIGYKRSISANYVSERHYNTIARYGMLSLTYNIKSKI